MFFIPIVRMGGIMARLVENPDLAFRLARAIVSDIALYNQEKVKEGIKNDNIFDLLADELRKAGSTFIPGYLPTCRIATIFSTGLSWM